jgi:periplasmic copper chaperone A
MHRAVIALAAGLLSVSAAAAEIFGREGWIREAPPVAPVRAGYAVLVNDGDREVVITSARSGHFGAVEIHTMTEGADGVMRMRRLPELRIPAGGELRLQPGGLHFMLFRPREALASGDEAALYLILADGSEILVPLRQR